MRGANRRVRAWGPMAYKLLLADDSVTIQRVIELTFADEDVQVVAVGDGQQAIDRITAEPPDIVLADVGMPARDGYEVAAFVKDSPGLSHIPVLLLTGAFEPVDDARAKAVRCNGVLAKPFEPQLLIARVKELLAPPAATATPEPAGESSGADDETGPVPIAAATETFELDQAPLGGPESATPASDLSLDDYFDRLDAAFASLSGAPARDQAAREGDVSWAPPAIGAWNEGTGSEQAAPPPLEERPTPARVMAEVARVPATPAAPVPVADAFAALLEAEQNGTPMPVFTPSDPVPAPADPVPPVDPVVPVTDALVDEIARRVAARLGDQAVRDIVAKVVSETAERLVREEIERLKAGASQ